MFDYICRHPDCDETAYFKVLDSRESVDCPGPMPHQQYVVDPSKYIWLREAECKSVFDREKLLQKAETVDEQQWNVLKENFEGIEINKQIPATSLDVLILPRPNQDVIVKRQVFYDHKSLSVMKLRERLESDESPCRMFVVRKVLNVGRMASVFDEDELLRQYRLLASNGTAMKYEVLQVLPNAFLPLHFYSSEYDTQRIIVEGNPFVLDYDESPDIGKCPQ